MSEQEIERIGERLELDRAALEFASACMNLIRGNWVAQREWDRASKKLEKAAIAFAKGVEEPT